MTNDTDSYPLKWPVNRQRTDAVARRHAAFRITIGKARDGLMKQLDRLGAKDVILSTNIATYERGGKQVMYADQGATQKDPGVACYYTWNGIQYVLACDKWLTVCDNLHALNKTVEAIRGIERWGSGDMLKAAFAGFKELPDPDAKNWWEVLGIEGWASLDVIKAAYKEKAKRHHPDVGGDNDYFIRIKEAYEMGLARCGQKTEV